MVTITKRDTQELGQRVAPAPGVWTSLVPVKVCRSSSSFESPAFLDRVTTRANKVKHPGKPALQYKKRERSKDGSIHSSANMKSFIVSRSLVHFPECWSTKFYCNCRLPPSSSPASSLFLSKEAASKELELWKPTSPPRPSRLFPF